MTDPNARTIYLVFFDKSTGVIRQRSTVSNGHPYTVEGLRTGIYEPIPGFDMRNVKVDLAKLAPVDPEYLPDVWIVGGFLPHEPPPAVTGA